MKLSSYHYSSQVHSFYQKNTEYTNKLREIFVEQKRSSVISSKSDAFCLTGHISPTIPNVPWDILEQFYNLFEHQTTAANSTDKITKKYTATSELLSSLAPFLDKSGPLFGLVAKYFYPYKPILHESFYFVRRRATTNSIPTSGYWHRDGVGPRVKVFFCISTGSNPPTTDIIPDPFLDPVPRDWEMFRTDSKQLNSTSYKKFLDVVSSSHVVSYDLKPHQILLFDTNCVHRGAYFPTISPSIDDRVLFQLSYGIKPSLDLFGLVNPYCSHKPIHEINPSLISRLALDETVFSASY